MYKDGLYLYFSDYDGHRFGPVKLNSIDDLEDEINKHRDYTRYMVIERNKLKGDTPIAQGEIERKVRSKRK